MMSFSLAPFVVRKAALEDFPRVLDFYWTLIDDSPKLQYSAKWTKDVYPTKDDLSSYIERGELYFAEEDGEIISAMAINRSCNDGYDKANWPSGLEEKETCCLHLLGVAFQSMGKGVGKKMVAKALEIARAQGAKAMRLDVVDDNLAAHRLYQSMGFSFMERILLFYEDTGWCYFSLYEKIL